MSDLQNQLNSLSHEENKESSNWSLFKLHSMLGIIVVGAFLNFGDHGWVAFWALFGKMVAALCVPVFLRLLHPRPFGTFLALIVAVIAFLLEFSFLVWLESVVDLNVTKVVSLLSGGTNVLFMCAAYCVMRSGEGWRILLWSKNSVGQVPPEDRVDAGTLEVLREQTGQATHQERGNLADNNAPERNVIEDIDAKEKKESGKSMKDFLQLEEYQLTAQRIEDAWNTAKAVLSRWERKSLDWNIAPCVSNACGKDASALLGKLEDDMRMILAECGAESEWVNHVLEMSDAIRCLLDGLDDKYEGSCCFWKVRKLIRKSRGRGDSLPASIMEVIRQVHQNKQVNECMAVLMKEAVLGARSSIRKAMQMKARVLLRVANERIKSAGLHCPEAVRSRVLRIEKLLPAVGNRNDLIYIAYLEIERSALAGNDEEMLRAAFHFYEVRSFANLDGMDEEAIIRAYNRILECCIFEMFAWEAGDGLDACRNLCRSAQDQAVAKQKSATLSRRWTGGVIASVVCFLLFFWFLQEKRDGWFYQGEMVAMSLWLCVCLVGGWFIFGSKLWGAAKKGVESYQNNDPQKALSYFLLVSLGVVVWFFVMNWGMAIGWKLSFFQILGISSID